MIVCDQYEGDIMEEKKQTIKQDLRKFISLPGEEIIFIKRKHIFHLLFPLLLIVFLTVLILAGLITLSLSPYISWQLLVVSVGIVVATSLFLTGKNIVEWNFHWYVITNRKILEVCYVPLSTYYINDILLDQVHCTEVDIRADGIINELLDMGDINIAFDRPTHHEGFLIHNVRSARKLGLFLSNFLMQQSKKQNEKGEKQLAWSKDATDKWFYREEVFPGTQSA